MLNFAEIPNVCPNTTVQIWFEYDLTGFPDGSHDFTVKLYSREKLQLVDQATGLINEIHMDKSDGPMPKNEFSIYRPLSLWNHFKNSGWDIGFFAKKFV